MDQRLPLLCTSSSLDPETGVLLALLLLIASLLLPHPHHLNIYSLLRISFTCFYLLVFEHLISPKSIK